MFCRNCGNMMNNLAAVCVRCGVQAGRGNSFCPNCGEASNPMAQICIRCGINLVGAVSYGNQKSKVVAGILGVFLGYMGIHRFYLGHIGIGLAQLLVFLFGTVVLGIVTCGVGFVLVPIIMYIWGFVEGIVILTGAGITKDAQGVPLK